MALLEERIGAFKKQTAHFTLRFEGAGLSQQNGNRIFFKRMSGMLTRRNRTCHRRGRRAGSRETASSPSWSAHDERVERNIVWVYIFLGKEDI